MTSTENDAIADVGAELEATCVDVRAVRADLRAAEGVETLYTAVTAVGRPVSAVALNAGVGRGGAFPSTPTSMTRSRSST